MQIFQLDCLLHVTNQIIAKVELHEALEVLQAVQARYLIVFEGELGQADQTLHIRDSFDLVGAKVKLLQILQIVQILYTCQLVFLKTELLKHS